MTFVLDVVRVFFSSLGGEIAFVGRENVKTSNKQQNLLLFGGGGFKSLGEDSLKALKKSPDVVNLVS